MFSESDISSFMSDKLDASELDTSSIMSDKLEGGSARSGSARRTTRTRMRRA